MRPYRKLTPAEWREIDAVLKRRGELPAHKQLAAQYGIHVGTLRKRVRYLRDLGVRVR